MGNNHIDTCHGKKAYELVVTSISTRIRDLERDAAVAQRAGDLSEALRIVHTARYLRTYLDEFFGPLWHASDRSIDPGDES
ncbi:hypothetical protein [Streptomyces griseoaurantiacus]|uniref:CHAD domain-containing protein n=1 Tax=Streptomyces griseoaurantiacus TaxID=68213 RepID=A0A7W2DSJ3_9ACTN|nr:hypothetical protein [Streptomyces griseoaurantiacus]MBA5222238.1 hypothetical protein [Streptomyces griseoaurantiacus]